MPFHHHRPLTDAEIAKIREHGPGFLVFKRAKDNRKQTRIRYTAYVIALVIVVGWGFLLYKYIISNRLSSPLQLIFLANSADLMLFGRPLDWNAGAVTISRLYAGYDWGAPL